MVKIYWNEPGMRELMKGNAIAKLEQDIMMNKLNEVQAQFMQRFGFEGKFELKKVDTNSNRSRTAFRIVAADARTTAMLKREPGWLAKFI